jgi:hypothetical protein
MIICLVILREHHQFTIIHNHVMSFFKEKSCPYNRNSCLFICRVDAGLLLSTLCYRTIKTPEGNIIKAVDSSAAIIGRDTLAKTVYARLFDWYDCVSSCCFTFFIVVLIVWLLQAC